MYLKDLDYTLARFKIKKHPTSIGWHKRIPDTWLLVSGLTSAPKFHCISGSPKNSMLRFILRDLENDNVIHFASWVKTTSVALGYNHETNSFNLIFDPPEDYPLYNLCRFEVNYRSGEVSPEAGIITYDRRAVSFGRWCAHIYPFTDEQECIRFGERNDYFSIVKIINEYKTSIDVLDHIASALGRYNAEYLRTL